MVKTGLRILCIFACMVLTPPVVTAGETGKSTAKRVEIPSVVDEPASPTATPRPNRDLDPPKVRPVKDVEAEYLPALNPVTLPNVQFPERIEPTPTPVPGRHPKDPTASALMSAIVPGLGHVYCGEPVRGLFFTAAFGISLFLTLDNFRLEPEPGSDQRVARNETAGSFYGLAALAAYGFGIQDAANSARRYNRRNHLNVSFDIQPYPHAALAYSF